MFPRRAFTTQLAAILLVASFASVAGAQGGKKAAPPAPAPQTAPAASGTPAAGPGNEKLDVSDLENKYWAAKDDDFNVVQNRLYSKAKRLAFTGYVGMYVGEPWSEGMTVGGDLAYFFSERNGAAFAYSMTQSKDNAALEELKRQSGVANHNKVKAFYGGVYNWVPFYAKMSVLNSSITYFDMSFSPGLGIQQYEQQREEGNQLKTAPAFTLDITQHFFLNKHSAVRIDYKNRWVNEEVISYRNNASRTSSTSTVRTDFLTVGFTLYY